MYNLITEEKIKFLPKIGDIDLDRLPKDLTKIYAQIVSLRRDFANGILTKDLDELNNSRQLLYALAINLETILLSGTNKDKKESIAFVAGIAQSLIHKMDISLTDEHSINLEADTISPLISAIILFLIGNSQADACEIANTLIEGSDSTNIKQQLILFIAALAKGDLSKILNNDIRKIDLENNDIQEIALDCLWREMSIGIKDIAEKLSKSNAKDFSSNSFDQVIDLSFSQDSFLNQKHIFCGPYHLAKLLKVLEKDILKRAIINIPSPKGCDPIKWEMFLEKLSLKRPYLWENHKEAIDTNFLAPGISAVLTLPTGAGKSTLSELKIASCLFSGQKVIYLVPTHALEDQINKNLKALFKEHAYNSIENDGEYTEFGYLESSPILVMTPERCLTLQNINPNLFTGIGLIVFDEFHLIHGTNNNKNRRSFDAMYCLISLFSLLPKADYMLISAMVENGKEISDWISSIIGRDCKLFNSSWKPTRQLHGCLIFEENDLSALKKTIDLDKISSKSKNPGKKIKETLNIIPYCFFSLKNIWETEDSNDYYKTQILDDKVLLGINPFWKLTTNRNDIAASLALHFANMGLKTLVFVDNPIIANSTSTKINDSLVQRNNSYNEFLLSNEKQVKSLENELGNLKFSYFNNSENVGVHHGLLLPIERSLIEEYFNKKDGSICLVATATLAQGMNLPAEIVIIAGDDRFEGDSREKLPPHELLNTAGRAGRAGQSSQGAVILIPGEIVSIDKSTISNKWWTLKKEIFSKSDQCLVVEDPLEYFLDSIQDESEKLDKNQINLLYKFKAENLSDTETKRILNKSFYAFKASRENKENEVIDKISKLIKRRNELDNLSEDVGWTKEISYKTGIDPTLILDLSKSIDEEVFTDFINLSITGFIEWFFNWIGNNTNRLNKTFPKESTIAQIKKAGGIKPDIQDLEIIIKELPKIKEILIKYVQGFDLEEINNLLPGRNDSCLTKARNFVIRLVPELSFSFGLLAMVIMEKAAQNKIEKDEVSWTIKALSSCIREGFDNVEKLRYKHKKRLFTRVDTHIKFNRRKK